MGIRDFQTASAASVYKCSANRCYATSRQIPKLCGCSNDHKVAKRERLKQPVILTGCLHIYRRSRTRKNCCSRMGVLDIPSGSVAVEAVWWWCDENL